MLAIRFQRQGRKNNAFFRVVLTESSRPPKSGFIKVLGWYNPHSKETSLEKEEILKWLSNGAQASNSVSKLLVANKIEHKSATYTPHAPKSSKSKGDEKASTPKEAEEAVETPEATTEEVVETQEAPAEEAPVIEDAPESAPEAEKSEEPSKE